MGMIVASQAQRRTVSGVTSSPVVSPPSRDPAPARAWRSCRVIWTKICALVEDQVVSPAFWARPMRASRAWARRRSWGRRSGSAGPCSSAGVGAGADRGPIAASRAARPSRDRRRTYSHSPGAISLPRVRDSPFFARFFGVVELAVEAVTGQEFFAQAAHGAVVVLLTQGHERVPDGVDQRRGSGVV